jgi:hypothetical protein
VRLQGGIQNSEKDDSLSSHLLKRLAGVSEKSGQATSKIESLADSVGAIRKKTSLVNF